MSALYQAILSRAAAHPDRIAIDDGAGPIRYGEIEGMVASAAAVVRQTLGNARGPVAIDMDNGVNWVLADLTLLAEGLPCVALPSFFTARQTEAALRSTGAIAVITARGIRRHKVRSVAIPPDAAKFSFASGSVPASKGICVTEATMLATAADIAERFGPDMTGVHLPVLPLSLLLENVAGFYATLLAGGTYAPLTTRAIGLSSPSRPNFSALLAAMVDVQATSLIFAPDLLAGLVTTMEARRMRLPALRMVAVAGQAPARLLERAAAVGLPIVRHYGLAASGSIESIDAPRNDDGGPAGAALAANGEVVAGGTGHRGKRVATALRGRAAASRSLQAATSTR